MNADVHGGNARRGWPGVLLDSYRSGHLLDLAGRHLLLGLRRPPVGARRDAHQLGEPGAEGAQRLAADLEAHLGDAEVAAAQQRHRALDASGHQVAVRRLPVGLAELAAQVTRRHVHAAARASTSSGWAYSRSMRSRTRLSRARSRSRCSSSGRVATRQMVPTTGCSMHVRTVGRPPGFRPTLRPHAIRPPHRQIPTAWFNVLPGCPSRCSRRCTRAPRSPSAPTTWRRCSRWGSSRRRCRAEPWIDIPGEVLDILRLWRPTPLVRAERLEQAARHAGAHLLQGRVGVARPGRTSRTPRCRRRSTTRPRAPRGSPPRPAPASGAPRWRSRARSSTSTARCTWCGRRSSRSRTARSSWRPGARECVPSPVDDPSSPGSLGLAISDAVRDAASRDDTHYSLGSVLNHVLLHQTVIGLEAKEQLALAGETRPMSYRVRAVAAPTSAASRCRSCTTPSAARRGRALVVPDAHRGSLRLRLRRHRRA